MKIISLFVFSMAMGSSYAATSDEFTYENVANNEIELHDGSVDNIDWSYWTSTARNFLSKYVSPSVLKELYNWTTTNMPSYEGANYIYNQVSQAISSTTSWTKNSINKLAADIVGGLVKKGFLAVVKQDVFVNSLAKLLGKILLAAIPK